MPHFTSSSGFISLFPPTVLLGSRNAIAAQFNSGIPIRQLCVTVDRESATE